MGSPPVALSSPADKAVQQYAHWIHADIVERCHLCAQRVFVLYRASLHMHATSAHSVTLMALSLRTKLTLRLYTDLMVSSSLRVKWPATQRQHRCRMRRAEGAYCGIPPDCIVISAHLQTR